ncbi:TonB-dependent receptor [Massilia arenosa]|uniref:TonB-dependent receptor n=1 Tax=Zemynaea arenosa TaxID=2561931 RepID=A0A4Y9S082_9BURK|nr:TonB-dependent receptor [Massilia arenosa]TFW13881.1 TonB-dependent receptor [Massilia arenosa]
MHRLTIAALAAAAAAHAQADGMSSAAEPPGRSLDTVVINGGRPSSLPTQIPTTIEGITAAEIEQRINALDSEDTLKYFPSLNVRKRFVGDYDHAVLASRASGTGNSARSLVYADGILLSNLLGNGASFTPRWGMVSPEEIERVDVLYGPFSAAYPGNSVGAVVDFQTQMPKRFEAHARLAGFTQHFNQYASDGRFGGGQGSFSVGDRAGRLAWWLDVARLDSDAQPISFATKTFASGTASSAGLPVTGAIAGRNPAGKDWWIIGSTTQSHTVQDHAKAKLAYDLTPTLRLNYTLGWWHNDSVRRSESYLRGADGAPVYRGDANNGINMGGRRYELRPGDLAPSIGDLEHRMHGLSLKSHTRGVWDWELALSRYEYTRDVVRTPTVFVADAATHGAGNVTDMHGSGWTTLALKGVWRPGGGHAVDLGYQRDTARLRTSVFAGSDWIASANGARVSAFNGNTRLQSLYGQDTWTIDSRWKAMLGARVERWKAFGGELAGGGTAAPLRFGERTETAVSPKAALSWAAGGDWTLKASLGRAVRNPTASELFQGSIVDNAIVNSDPNLQAEKSWTSELTAEHASARGTTRITYFHEATRNALYSQPLTATVNTVQNIGKVRTNGVEIAAQYDDVMVPGLSLGGSVTYADSLIAENARFAATVGKHQPRVPDWRANGTAAWTFDEHWSATLGVRYSGRQWGTLDNSDPVEKTYMGVSKYLVADVRVRYRVGPHWSLALGIDNLNNESYWAFHPYTQRTLVGELRWDY